MGTAARRLKSARRMRRLTSAALRALSEGDIHIENVLGTPPVALKRVSIDQLLRHTPYIGEKGAEHIEKRAKVWPTHRLGNLTAEERAALVDALPDRVRLGR